MFQLSAFLCTAVPRWTQPNICQSLRENPYRGVAPWVSLLFSRTNWDSSLRPEVVGVSDVGLFLRLNLTLSQWKKVAYNVHPRKFSPARVGLSYPSLQRSLMWLWALSIHTWKIHGSGQGSRSLQYSFIPSGPHAHGFVRFSRVVYASHATGSGSQRWSRDAIFLTKPALNSSNKQAVRFYFREISHTGPRSRPHFL